MTETREGTVSSTSLALKTLLAFNPSTLEANELDLCECKTSQSFIMRPVVVVIIVIIIKKGFSQRKKSSPHSTQTAGGSR